MARIAIAEPDTQVRQLYAEIVTELGHEPVAAPPCDLLLLEPAWDDARRQAEILRAAQPDLPIVCVSSRRPNEWTDELCGEFLRKPHSLDDLRRAITDSVS
jgi:hypothetical protein